ncbi:carboxypeptidase regulatory-like domain-containing protein [Lysobacter sp. BMK333-48F3]|uniref:carboxypeptidase regulatory-like domain-containing protein n=1 Tax=Lysobacter sp. BMK333-48F3 TaxID=2867962 RepID=UPI001C8C3F47|nr:carboxypeptidase regulatory-like domain-containing protein [Lysobacter sp. BMK333-48F3]MBX9399688.1 carboxypeptidase regulatory-like domain-containing protein [Lysobacter sp. BMK333-48F3]
MKGIKAYIAIGLALLALLSGMRDGLAEDAQLDRGLDWLQGQVQSNGSLSSERDSVAVVEQVRTEAAHTLAQAGRTSALPDLSPSELSDLSTELLARRVMGLGAVGRVQDAAETLNSLVGRANRDGGFGGASAQPSNALDTSLALLAMRSGGMTRSARVEAALGYLVANANADGSYHLAHATYTTAYALQAFVRYRNDYSLNPAIARTRAALVAQQSDGAYGDSVSNAVATIALAQSGPLIDTAAAVAALRAAQGGDGSWAGDPYVTALALRALLVASDAPSMQAGQIAGAVFDADSGLPVAQAQIALAGAANAGVSGADGGFVLENVAAGTYTVTVAHVGYADHVGQVVVEGGSTSQLGRILLRLADQTAALRGTVSDSRSAQPLAGASVQLSGPLDTQTQTDAQGRYELIGLPAGQYTIQVGRSGYQSLSQSAQLPARTAVSFSPALTPDGDTPPTTALARGIVVKADDGTPIAGARVELAGQSALTGADGRFSIEPLAAGAFTGSAQAGGYDSVSFSGVLVNGSNDLGRIPLAAAQTRRSLIGTVTSSATGAPLAGVSLTLNGAAAGQTDAAGQYRIEDTGSAQVELRFDAVGYQSRTATTRLENPGVYRIDAQLDDLREGSFQVLNLRAAPAALKPGETMRISADIANLNDEAKPALVLVRLLDSAGAKVAQLCGAESPGLPPQCEYAFDPRQTKSFVLDWTATNLPAGRYTLALHVVAPGSVIETTPLGLIYGMDSREIEIAALLGLQGSVTPSPPVMIPNSPSGVDFSATLQNKGNALIEAGEARLTVTRRSDGTLAHSATVALPELLPNAIAELGFGRWQPPATGAEYDLRVVSTDPRVGGAALGEFFVGDAATAEFQVTPTQTGDGNQRVEAVLTVKGVDNRTGQGSDPLFALVRAAVQRGGGYTSVNALNWQRSNQCLGCHIQTQSLYGLGSSIDKADVDKAAALYLQNSQSATVQSDRSIHNAHPGFRNTSSMLGLWSMAAWPDRRATFNARYRVADYLLDRTVRVANGAYWNRDHDTGWLVEGPAASATVVEGMVSVLSDAERFGIAQMREYRPVQHNGPSEFVDLAGAPDGRVFALQRSGAVLVYDPAANTVVPFFRTAVGAVYTGIAVGGDGAVYVSSRPQAGKAPVIERISPDAASSATVATLPVPADAIDFTPDGKIAALNYGERSLYLADLAAGTQQRISIGGLIVSPSNVTAAADGALMVTSDSAFGAVRVARDGTQSRAYEGSMAALRDLAYAGDGRAYAGGAYAITEISADGLMESHAVAGGRYRMAVAAGKVYGLSSTGNWTIYEHEPVFTQIAPRLAQMREAVEQSAKYFETYANNGVSSQAFRLMILAEARPYIADAALAGKVDARVAELVQELRSAQRADGGWSRYAGAGQPSDPLVTAIVGTALDYNNPLPTDPVLRKTVQYLLTKQNPDGSWYGQYFSTHLGATSYVMAYLPKAVARLGGIDVGLGLEFGPDVRLLGSSVTPDSSTVHPDGSSAYGFTLGRIDSSGARFVFSLELVAMRIDEWRRIAQRAFLRFVNSFNGETVEAPIAIPSVHAASKYQLSLALNAALFRANEDVLVQPTVRNGGSSHTSGSLRYFIETAEGAPVAELPVVGFTDLAIGDQRTLPQPWNTGVSRAGDYRARVLLLSPDGQTLGEAVQPFSIQTTSTGPQLSSAVATDKPVYDPFEVVQVLGKVRNLTLNSRYEQLTVSETVTTPAGTTLWTGSLAIETLNPSTTLPAHFQFNLVAAPAGAYTVTQVVSAADGTVLDTRTAGFQVRSSSVGGAGLSGTIAAIPEEVEAGSTSSLTVGLRNQGNADFSGLPVIVSVIDPQSENVLASWTEHRELAVGAQLSYAQPWNTAGVAPGQYQAVLQARVGDRLVTLAHAPVRVIELPVKAEMSQAIVATGRVLVLVSCKDSGGCHGYDAYHDHALDHAGEAQPALQSPAPESTAIVASGGGHGGGHDQCARDRAAFIDALLTQMGIEHKVVTEGTAFAREYATGRYDTYWISGGAEKLANRFAQELREAVQQGDGLFVEGSHDSRNQIVNDALGVKFQGQLSGNRHAAVMSGEFDVGRFDAGGDALRYVAIGAQVKGRYDSATGTPAFFVNAYGTGRSALAGFDFVQALIDADSAAQARELLRRTLAHVMPQTPAYGLAGGYLSVRTQVRNLAKPVELELLNQALAPLRVEDGTPQPQTLSSALALWRFPLALAQTREFRVSLRLPAASGSYTLDSLLRTAGGQQALASNRLGIVVARPADLVALLQRDLDALPLTSPPDRNARNRVKSYLSQAGSDLQAGRRDSAVDALLKAIGELAKIRSVSTADCRVQLATLVKAARVAALP